MTIDGWNSKASLQANGNPLFNYFNEIVPTFFDRLSGSDHYGFYLIALWLLMPLFSGAQRAVKRAEVPCPPSTPGRLGYSGGKGCWMVQHLRYRFFWKWELSEAPNIIIIQIYLRLAS